MPDNRNVPDGFYWSPSRHSLATTCPSCFIRKYVYNEPREEEDYDYFRYGEVLHAAMEGRDVKEAMEKAGMLEDGMRAMAMIHKHLKDYEKYEKLMKFGKRDKPEYEFKLTLHHPVTGEAAPCPFYGIVDRLLCKAKPWGWVDYKSSKNEWSQGQIDRHKQFTFYTMAFTQENGFEPKAFIINFVKDMQKPYARGRKVERSVQDCVKVFEEMVQLHHDLVENPLNCKETCRKTRFCPVFKK